MSNRFTLLRLRVPLREFQNSLSILEYIGIIADQILFSDLANIPSKSASSAC
jgi:hypothetical protein